MTAGVVVLGIVGLAVLYVALDAACQAIASALREAMRP